MRKFARRRWLGATLAALAAAGCFATPQPTAVQAPERGLELPTYCTTSHACHATKFGPGLQAPSPNATAMRHLLMVGAVPGPSTGQTLNTPLRWNAAVTDYLATHAPDPPSAARALALVHIAIYFAASYEPSDPVAQDAAIARAAYGVLAYLFPQDESNLYTLAVNLYGNQSGPGQGRGLSEGANIATQVVAYAQGDGSGYPPPPLSATPGLWYAPTQLGNGAGDWRPWLLDATSNYTLAAPPSPGTAAFQSQLASVEASSNNATASQQALALSWSKNPAPLDTQTMADAVLARHALTPVETAAVLAWLNMVLADTAIATWHNKYLYRLERPQDADHQFFAFLAPPSYPAYPSAQAAFTQATATFLSGLFPDEAANLAAQAGDAGNSRQYGGIAYPLDTTTGDSLGTRIAQLGLTMAQKENWSYSPTHPNPVSTPSPLPSPSPSTGIVYTPFPGVPVPPWPLPTDTKAAIMAAGLPILTNMAQVAYHIHIHLDVYYNGLPVTVPANLAIDPAGTYLSALHTHDTTGVIHVESPDISGHWTIGQLFTEWQVPLTGAVAYDNGVRQPDAAGIYLQNLHEVAIVFGTPPAQIPSSFDWASW
ncbi:MAG TPA: hypothetical protein V6D47_12460 [Oscillatoriaceae cyanobacterium]